MPAKGRFVTSPWLNTFVFPPALDSVMNDFGILLMSGTFKPLLDWSPRQVLREMFLGKKTKVASESVPPVFHSQTDDNKW